MSGSFAGYPNSFSGPSMSSQGYTVPPSTPYGSYSLSSSLSNLPQAPSSNAAEHPQGEHPSRTLFVRNINSNVEDDEIRDIFEVYGPTRSIYTQCKHRGFIMVSFYDIRHAKQAIRHLQGKVLRRRKLDIHYSIPRNNPSEKEQNQGTLVVFNLDPATGRDELMAIFGHYGEVKEIRETPNKKHHKFIEFFDVRHAENAMRGLNKTEIKGKKIKIEPSRPGGRKEASLSSGPYESTLGDEALLQQYPQAVHESPPASYDPRLAGNSFLSQQPFGGGSRFTVGQQPMMTSSSYAGYAGYPATRTTSQPQSPAGARRMRSQSSMSSYSTTPTPQQWSGQRSPARRESEANGLFSLNLDHILSGAETRTTLMIRNIPNKYTQKMLLSKVDECHKGLYDFFYLPIDFKVSSDGP